MTQGPGAEQWMGEAPAVLFKDVLLQNVLRLAGVEENEPVGMSVTGSRRTG